MVGRTRVIQGDGLDGPEAGGGRRMRRSHGARQQCKTRGCRASAGAQGAGVAARSGEWPVGRARKSVGKQPDQDQDEGGNTK